jgi:hypothetical protein
VVSEVRLLHATEAELPAQESAREQAYRLVDPGQLARSLPGVAAVGGPALAAPVGDVRRFPDGASFRSFTGLAPRASETGETDRKGQPMSKAGPRLLRTTLLRAADNARHLDPQLARLYYVQVVERGACHLKALCVVAAHLAERAWAVLSRGAPYEFRDVDGTLLTPQEAKAMAARWKVPDEVRQHRRSRKQRGGEGPSASPPGTRTERSRRPHEATFPGPNRGTRPDPDQAGTDHPPGANQCSLLTSPSRLPARKIGKGWALLLSDVQAFKRQERKTGRPPRWPMAPPTSLES